MTFPETDPYGLLVEWMRWWKTSDAAPAKMPDALHVRTALALLAHVHATGGDFALAELIGGDEPMPPLHGGGGSVPAGAAVCRRLREHDWGAPVVTGEHTRQRVCSRCRLVETGQGDESRVVTVYTYHYLKGEDSNG